MSKIPSPFKLLTHSEDGITFEAIFDLPNDGTPTKNQLVINVSLEREDSDICTVSLIGRTFKDTLIGEFDCRIEKLGNVLYNFARVKTKQYLSFDKE